MAVTLPPIWALSFLLPIYAQAILLHERVPERTSRVLRVLLTPLAASMASVAPFQYQMQPVDMCIGLNFRWAIFGPYFFLKALEFGLVRDRSAYTWLGFDEDEQTPSATTSGATSREGSVTPLANGKSNGAQEHTELRRRHVKEGAQQLTSSPEAEVDAEFSRRVERSKPRRRAMRVHRQDTRDDTVWDMLVWAGHLCASMRGAGWAFGPPKGHFPPRSYSSSSEFFWRTLGRFMRASTSATICLFVMSLRPESRTAILRTIVPFLPEQAADMLGWFCAWLCVGFNLHWQMLIGYEGFALAYVITYAVLRATLPESWAPPPFEHREWPPFFDAPSTPTSVTDFWARRWHCLFRKVFMACGFEPANAAVLRLTRSKVLGRLAGVLATFILSAYLHDMAFAAAHHGSSSFKERPLTFSERWGANIYFVVMALAITAEAIFYRLTKRRVGGWAGRLWSYAMIGGVGFLAGRSWLARGFIDGVPEPHAWTWERYVVPNAAMLPAPIYTLQ